MLAHGSVPRQRLYFYDPRGVWLFGSRARDTARPQSDWEILVVVDDAAQSGAARTGGRRRR
jgi:predicted nucleotidyltransferase